MFFISKTMQAFPFLTQEPTMIDSVGLIYTLWNICRLLIILGGTSCSCFMSMAKSLRNSLRNNLAVLSRNRYYQAHIIPLSLYKIEK